MFPTTVALLASALLLHATEAACPDQRPTKHLLCYVEQISAQFDPCLCTHLVLQTPLDKLSPQSDLLKSAKALQEKNPALKLIAEASDVAEIALKRRDSYAKTVASVVDKCKLDGVELDLHWGAKVAGKVQLVDLVQSISKEFKSLQPNVRTKRDYKIYEQSNDDVTTPQWTPPNSKARPRKTRSSEVDTKKETKVEEKKIEKEEEEEHRSILLRLAPEPQHLAKNFDLKRLSKYVDLYTIASDNLTDASEHGLAYHPSRLMGIQDILNADSLIDLLTGLGAPHEKLILSLPARALKFSLKDPKKNLPQSPVTGAPQYISQSELCTAMSEGNWTVERDEDLTAPYAFHDKTWIAFDDAISTSIKGKYVLLRDLAGGAVVAAEAEDWAGKCNTTKPAVLATLYDIFTNVARKSRAAQLISLQEELHESAQYSYSGDIHLSPYRIVRVVDRAGAIHVVRKEAKTEFECSRQGYFTHPSGCNRFYRCVKFNQYTPDFTVFEYDCPAGLAFDERYEVCVWPGSLPDGGACQGSSEIAPVPRGRYVCPRVEGYYADPENCRWFFACLDHVRDGVTPLTAYEFRCPFGLVFNEKALVCDWPWLVEGCGGVGAFRATFSVGDFYEGRHRASYASLSDVHVSGGRIENAPGAGGVVLGSSVIGGLASGSNVHSSGAGLYGGAYAAKGYSGGAYDYSALSGAYAGRGSASEGGAFAGGHSSGAGLYSGSEQSGGAGGLYVAGGHASGAGLYSGSEHSGGAGAYVAGGHLGGAGLYSGSEHSGSAGGLYMAGGHSSGAGLYSGSEHSGGAGGLYVAGGHSSSAGLYSGSEHSGGAGAYVAGGSGGSKYYSAADAKINGYATSQYGGAGVYGGSSGYSAGSSYTSGGAGYRGGVSDTTAYTEGGEYEAGKYAGSNVGLGYSGGIGSGAIYTGVAVDDSGKYEGQYSGVGKGAYSSSSIVSQSGGTNYVPAYKLSGGYDAGQISYHGGYGQKSVLKTPSVPVTLVSDAISSGYNHDLSGFNLVSEHKPVNFVNVESVKVTPGSDVISGSVFNHLTPVVTPSPLPAVSVSTYSAPVIKTVTQSPISISSYQPQVVYQPSTPRPTTYYVSPSLSVTPAPVTYKRPLVSAVTPVSVTPSPLPALHISTYQQPLVQSVTPLPQVSKIPTVLKTPVVPLNPIQYSTPAPFSFGYSSPAPVHISSPAPLEPVHISTPAPVPAVSSVHFSYPKPAIGVVKTPVVPYNPVSYTLKQPVAPIQLSTPAPAVIKTITQAPVVYQEEYTYQKPLQPIYQKTVPVQPVLPVQPIQYHAQPHAPAVSYTYSYNKASEIKAPVAVTPSTLAVEYSPSPATIVKPLDVKYSYPRPTVLKTPVVPLNPIQYSTPAPIEYAPSPATFVKPLDVKYSYPQPAVLKTPVVPLNPIQYSTPAPIEYAPSPATFVKPLNVKYSYPQPAVLKTPVVPLNPIQYSTPAPIEYAPSPATFVKPLNVKYSYPQPAVLKTPVVPLNPIQYSTPAPIEYAPSPATFVKPLDVKYSYPRPTVLKTPVVPLNPIQYSTPAPIEYAPSPATFVKPLDVKYSYPRPTVLKTPVVPLNPIQYSTPAPIEYAPSPATFVKPLEVKYSYPRPTVLKTPVVPLNPIEYSTPAPSPVSVNLQYSAPVHSYSQSEITVEKNLPLAPVQPVSFVKAIPRPAFRAPIQYSTPAPIAFEYPSPKPIQFRPAVLKTPIVPLNPVQYTTPAPAYFEHSTPAPAPIAFEYPSPKPIQFRPAVLKTPVVPLNPVQYTTPAPAYFEHSTPAPAPYLPPLSPISSVKFGTAYKAPLTVTEQAYSVDYSYQQPIKSPVTPVSVEYSSVTPAPIQQVKVNYNYPKPIKQELPILVSTTPAIVHQTVTPTVPMYQRVINAFKAPVVTAYQKVLDVITSSTPSTLIQPVTQSPVSYTPVDVGYSYKKPALVKTQSIPVTPVNVVPAYQKVLNVVKASTTPATLYANHYTSTYETPQVVVSTPKPAVISESSFGLDFSNHGFDGNTDEFYETVRQSFGSKLGSESYKQEFSGYEYKEPAVKFTEGVSFVKQNIPVSQDVSYYSSTTEVPVIKQTYRKPVKAFIEYEQPAYNVEFESGKLSGYKEVVAKTPVVQGYGGHVGVEYDGSIGYSQIPVVTSTSTVAPIIKQQEYAGHVGVEYDGSIGYAQVPVTSTTPAPTVEITTARVSLPVVKSRPVDAYRRKQSRLRPVLVTESYPTSTLKSTFTPTVFTPTYYTSPAAYSTTAAYEGEELDIEGEDEDDSAKLLEAYDGQFGGVLTKGVSVSEYAGESSTVANIKDGEAIVGVLKKGRVDYTGRKTKSKVVVVSRLSDFNPILVGKLGAECSCSPKSNTLSLRRRGKTQQLFTPNDHLQPLPDQTLTDTYVTSTSTLSPEVSGYEEQYGASFYSEKQVDSSPIVEIKPLVGKTVFSTTVAPIVDTAALAYQAPVKLSKTIKTYSENSLRPTYQEVLQKSDISFADAGKSFDRYGPGGLRGVDEVLQGSVDCKRAGLFRHPKYCNKFYACNWDQWKGRFTLHVFNCPVHLAYDTGLGACNWPSKGPACADDNLLV